MLNLPCLKHRKHSFRKITSILLSLVFVGSFYVGCGSGSEVVNVEESKKANFQSFQLDVEGESISFAELIDKIEITRLEETEESLLGYVLQVEFFKDKMVIPGTDGNINIFSKTGEFLKGINRKGDGPEEYSGWNDFWLEGDTLNLYNYRKSIIRYDLEGNFISRDQMLEQAAHVHPFGSGYALDMNYRLTQDSLKYSLVTLNHRMELNKTFLPFVKLPNFWISMSNKTIFPNGDDLLYFPMMKDTVYQIESDTVKPIIHYDFGDDWFFQPGVGLPETVMEDAEKKGLVWFMINKIGANHIYLNGVVGTSSSHSFLINRQSEEAVRIDFSTENEEEFQMSAISWIEDDFLVSLQSSQLSELLDLLDEDQYLFTQGSTLDVIESSENPVLVRIKIKDFSKN